GPLFVGVYTDWKWFGAIDYRGVFNTAIIARVVLFIVTAVIAGLIVWLAGFFVWRGRPDNMDLGDLNSPVYQYRQAIEKSVEIGRASCSERVSDEVGATGRWRE